VDWMHLAQDRNLSLGGGESSFQLHTSVALPRYPVNKRLDEDESYFYIPQNLLQQSGDLVQTVGPRSAPCSHTGHGESSPGVR
jgi:hypothetical protein